MWKAVKRLLGYPAAVSGEAIRHLNPDRIRPEDIHVLIGASRWMSEEICEDAARRGLFVKVIDNHSVYYSLVDSALARLYLMEKRSERGYDF